MPFSADSWRGRIDGASSWLNRHWRRRSQSDRSVLPLTALAVGWRHHLTGETLLSVLTELTAIQAAAIRATAAAHDRNPDELALEFMHLLATDEAPRASDATPTIPELTTDHHDTVRILLPRNELHS